MGSLKVYVITCRSQPPPLNLNPKTNRNSAPILHTRDTVHMVLVADLPVGV